MSTVTRRAQPWLGTLVEVGIRKCEGDSDAAFSAAFAAVARMHNAMSPQRAQSDLARFNAAPAGAAIDCDEWTLAVLAAARELGEASAGAFDVSLGSGGPGGWSVQNKTLCKQLAATRLDLGGIAKGEAVDRACAALRAAGVSAGWVNAGGDLRAFGDIGLPVHVRDPENSALTLPLAELHEGSIATSRFNPAQYPATLFRQVSVAAPQCRWADALTKVMALAPDLGRALLPRYHARAWTSPL